MMKVVVLWVWLLVFGVAFVLFTTEASAQDKPPSIAGSDMKASAWTRKLKEERVQKSDDSNNLNLEDYQQIDPAPISSTVTSGPIEHGTPLNPYISWPKPGCDLKNDSCSLPPTLAPTP